MTPRYAALTFTGAVKALQDKHGSRQKYARLEQAGGAAPDPLTEREAAFIAARDSFYMATVGEDGWPYVQHRGGPPGFLAVIDAHTLAFADFLGNAQYISVGNLAANDRVSLFLMDYPDQRRLKILGRARIADENGDADILARVGHEDYPAVVERALVIGVEALSWNCTRHITPRFTVAEMADVTQRLIARIHELEARIELAQYTRPAGE